MATKGVKTRQIQATGSRQGLEMTYGDDWRQNAATMGMKTRQIQVPGSRLSLETTHSDNGSKKMTNTGDEQFGEAWGQPAATT